MRFVGPVHSVFQGDESHRKESSRRGAVRAVREATAGQGPGRPCGCLGGASQSCSLFEEERSLCPRDGGRADAPRAWRGDKQEAPLLGPRGEREARCVRPCTRPGRGRQAARVTGGDGPPAAAPAGSVLLSPRWPGRAVWARTAGPHQLRVHSRLPGPWFSGLWSGAGGREPQAEGAGRAGGGPEGGAGGGLGWGGRTGPLGMTRRATLQETTETGSPLATAGVVWARPGHSPLKPAPTQ